MFLENVARRGQGCVLFLQAAGLGKRHEGICGFLFFDDYVMGMAWHGA